MHVACSPGHEGRAGMAAVIVRPEHTFDGKKLFDCVLKDLPAYARPLFIRLQVRDRTPSGRMTSGRASHAVRPQEVMEMTSTFKQQKFHLVQSGFDPSCVPEPLFVIDYSVSSYVALTDLIYQNILSGHRKL